MLKFVMYIRIIILCTILHGSCIFAQEKSIYSTHSMPKKVALIVQNNTIIVPEVNMIIDELANQGYLSFLVADQKYDLQMIYKDQSFFAKDIAYVVKLNIEDTFSQKNGYNIYIKSMRLSDGKEIEYSMLIPSFNNSKMVSSKIIHLLNTLNPTVIYTDPLILDVQKSTFLFNKLEFPGLKKGDEITIQYTESRKGIRTSYAIVNRFAQDQVIAQDMSRRVQVGDKVLHVSPHRHRLSINIGAVVPMLGEKIIKAHYQSQSWKSSRATWPAGFQIELEYERFLPYCYVFTTLFGLNMDGALGTYFFAGVGYRCVKNLWECVPYIRLGVLYNSLVLKNSVSNAGDLQGIDLKFGVNIGLNILKRINSITFVGVDMGVQYYPLESLSVFNNSKKIDPVWDNQGHSSQHCPLASLYPYISVKLAWVL